LNHHFGCFDPTKSPCLLAKPGWKNPGFCGFGETQGFWQGTGSELGRASSASKTLTSLGRTVRHNEMEKHMTQKTVNHL